ncbi:hypothetical protein K378_01160 [Streptomyces sp. Amel2xB2]|nr:hypothetical protein K378_01160 [Streptomyces sp. Amel2xB2]
MSVPMLVFMPVLPFVFMTVPHGGTERRPRLPRD